MVYQWHIVTIHTFFTETTMTPGQLNVKRENTQENDFACITLPEFTPARRKHSRSPLV